MCPLDDVDDWDFEDINYNDEEINDLYNADRDIPGIDSDVFSASSGSGWKNKLINMLLILSFTFPLFFKLFFRKTPTLSIPNFSFLFFIALSRYLSHHYVLRQKGVEL